ncbi:MAG TPA: chemotaxis protein CheA [Candidatus Ozemobacteraceae bacterium]|nr:chemotaxis protein CheA [Candidatus Ozemobacteraceae bacterium]
MNLTERNDEWRMLVEVFATESMEMLDEVEPRLVELEKNPDPAVINNIFRLFHSLKGGAASLGLQIIRDLTHEAETLLDLFRSKGKKIESAHIDLMCQSCDLTRQIITKLQEEFDDAEFEAEASALRLELVQAVMDLVDDSPPNLEVYPGAHRNYSPSDRAASEAVTKPSSVSAAPSKPANPLPGPNLASSIDELKLDITPEMCVGFAAEADELLEAIETNLVAFEKEPGRTGLLAEAFRAFHSLKGNCGFFGFVDLEHLSHESENLLGAMRDSQIPADRANVSLVLSTLDVCRATVKSIKASGPATIADLEPMVTRLKQALKTTEAPKLGEILIAKGEVSADALQEALEEQEQQKKTKPAATTPVKSEDSAAKDGAGSGKQSIRVDTEKLDRLIELVGELVISEANVANCAELRNLKIDRIEKSIDQLNKITKDLQNIAMSVRMIPIAGLFRKMVRPVRDLARTFGKKIDLQFIGEETEVDKNVIELVSDPLMHLIRNSVDHGIEPPADRTKCGKPEEGVIVLEARHAGGEVWIMVRDDGRGLNRDKILAKARQVGLCTTDGSDLRDEEIYKFIFEPGFSTADKVTEVSGRGVGMDVVKRNIEKLKGRVDIKSSPGKGSSMIIRIPLTLAIIEGMVVQVGAERYIMPTQAILEFIRPTSDLLASVIDQGEVINIRGHLIPLFRIASIFGIRNAITDPTQANVMIIEHEGKSYGLMVDQILGQQQTVVKSLGATLGYMQGIAGAAVMPDGKVGLILDLGGLIPLFLGTQM